MTTVIFMATLFLYRIRILVVGLGHAAPPAIHLHHKQVVRKVYAAAPLLLQYAHYGYRLLDIHDVDAGAETGITAASATAITADELIDLFYSLKSPYRRNAVWVLNDSTIKAIRKLKDSNGQYLWQPSLTAGTPDTILGRPVRTSAYMPAIAASAKTIAFGDFSYYWIADRQGRSFKRLNELYAANGQVGFLASQRVDGKLILSEAIKVLAQKAST